MGTTSCDPTMLPVNAALALPTPSMPVTTPLLCLLACAELCALLIKLFLNQMRLLMMPAATLPVRTTSRWFLTQLSATAMPGRRGSARGRWAKGGCSERPWRRARCGCKAPCTCIASFTRLSSTKYLMDGQPMFNASTVQRCHGAARGEGEAPEPQLHRTAHPTPNTRRLQYVPRLDVPCL